MKAPRIHANVQQDSLVNGAMLEVRLFNLSIIPSICDSCFNVPDAPKNRRACKNF